MKFSTTIKRKYWGMKMADARANGGLFDEYKDATPFWNKRLTPIVRECACCKPVPAVFLVGRVVHRATIVRVSSIPRSYVPEKYQGAVTTDMVYELMCSTTECFDGVPRRCDHADECTVDCLHRSAHKVCRETEACTVIEGARCRVEEERK
jgi:hypothetical protein